MESIVFTLATLTPIAFVLTFLAKGQENHTPGSESGSVKPSLYRQENAFLSNGFLQLKDTF